MKKIFFSLLLSLSIFSFSQAQEVGLSFSYFIPRNGYFSTPISPFSIRGLGVNLNRFVALETGASLYRMSGLNIIDLPFESKSALLGPNFTVFVPAEIVFQLQSDQIEFDLKGGAFFFYGIDNKINYGNFDRAIRDYNSWTVANSSLSGKNHPGFGYIAGGELTLHLNRQFGISFEVNYLLGQANFPLSGSSTGGSSSLETININYQDAKIDFTGLEFSIGLIFSGR
jgi:hypothetical protein